jgi:hypothetical protein
MKHNKDSTKYFGWYVPQPDGRVDFAIQNHDFEPEAWDEFNRIVEVTAELRPTVIDYLSLVDDFALLNRIEADLATSLQDLPNPTAVTGVGIMLAFVKAQRALSNFLSAASAFRDRACIRLAELYGRDSRELTTFNRAIKAAYDASFAYGVLYNLRNYAQHHDSPLSILPIKGVRDNADDSMVFEVKLMLRWEDMYRSNRIQKPVRAELQSRTESEIELLPLAHDYMRRYADLMREFISLQAVRLDEMRHYAQVVLTKSGLPKGAIPVIWEGGLPSEGKANYDFHHFSFDELGFLAKLYTRLVEGEISL